MKHVIKVLSLVLTFFILCTTATFAADNSNPVFEAGEHTDTIAFLDTLNIVDSAFMLSGSSSIVTRGEFAKLIADIMPVSASKSFDAVFADVSAEHPYAPYIYALKNAGYMSGVSKTIFNPDSPIYYEQAVSVCVKIAGYGPVADSFGKYPEGYLHQAARMGILENVISKTSAPISKGNIIELIYNTVLCDMMIINGYGDEGSYVIYEDENILSYYHKIYSGKGIVNADNIYTMTSSHSGKDNLVVIDGEYYYKNDSTVLSNSVGRRVEFWYLKEGSKKTILFSRKYDTNEVIFSSRAGLELDFSAATYTLYENNKAHIYKLSDNYNAIYNMEELYPVTKRALTPETGTITLIDNNDDGYYDVIIVDEFKNLVVDMYNKNLNVITDIADHSRNLKLDDFDRYRIYDKSGNELDENKIKTNSVIEVYKSISGKHLTAVVCSDVASGTYIEQTEDGIIVDVSEYVFSADVRADKTLLNIGNVYDFYINADREIVYWTLSTGYREAYILGVNEGKGMDNVISVKLLTQGGKVEVYPLSDKVNNMTEHGESSIKKSSWQTIFPETNTREFVLYKLNDKKQISTVVHAKSIDTRSDFGTDSSYPLQKLNFFATEWKQMDSYIYNNELYFRGGINGFDNMLIFTDDAKLYRVPSVSYNTIDEKSVSVTPVKSTISTDYTVKFTDNYTGDSGTMMTYMVGDSYPFANVMVEHAGGAGASVSREQPSVTVVAIRNTYDTQTLEKAYYLEVWNGEKIVNVNVENESKISRENFISTKINNALPTIDLTKSKIEVGDIIKYTSDESGFLNSLALMYDSTSKKLCYDTAGFGNQYYNLSKGTVSKVRSNFIEVEIDVMIDDGAGVEIPGKRWEIMDVSDLPTFIVDPEKDKPFIGSPLDIEIGDTVLRYSKASNNRSLTIYKQ